MAQTESTKKRKQLYAAAWRLAHPDYHRLWNIAHREDSNRRKREFRRLHPRTRDYVAEYAARHREQSSHSSLPSLFLGHPILEQAQALAGRPWYGGALYDATREDAAGEAVLAILEGRDPEEAIHAFMADEREWHGRTVSLFPNVAIREDTRQIVFQRPFRD